VANRGEISLHKHNQSLGEVFCANDMGRRKEKEKNLQLHFLWKKLFFNGVEELFFHQRNLRIQKHKKPIF
jgi:hypothetical protein